MNAPQREAGYVFDFGGRQYDPNGTVQVSDVDTHNRAVEAAELATWATQPDRWIVYVDLVNMRVTTWLGTELGTLRACHVWTFRHNFGSRMTTIRFRGTNGATYAGRFGSDWSQACKVRKVRS